MESNSSALFELIRSLVQTSIQADCASSFNSEEATPVLSSFLYSHLPDALYVVLRDKTFSFSPNLLLNPTHFDLLIIIIKQAGPVNDSIPLLNQIHIISVPGSPQDTKLPVKSGLSKASSDLRVETDSTGAYEQIQSLISLCITPYFDLVAQNDPSHASSIPVANAKKKFNELLLSLTQLQQRISTPNLLLSVPKHISIVLENSDSPSDQAVLSDSALLNDLTRVVNNWINQIQTITSIFNNYSGGKSIGDEIQFWSALETALMSLRDQTSHPDVKRAIEILNAARRFQASLAFQNDLGINEVLEKTQAYNNLLKDLPIADLYIVRENRDLSQLESTVETLFAHLKKWKGSGSFPVSRLCYLVELLSDEICVSFCDILESLNLLGISYSKFQQATETTISDITHSIERNVKFMINLLREVMRKRQEKFKAIKIETKLLELIKDRVHTLQSIRSSCEELISAFHELEESQTHAEYLALVYSKNIVPANPFDFSKQGVSLWENHYQAYLDLLSRVESSMSALINQKMSKGGSFADYLWIFRKLLSSSRTDGTSFLLSHLEDQHKLHILSVAHNEINDLIELSYNIKLRISNDKNTMDVMLETISWELSLKAKASFYLDSLIKLFGDNWNKYTVGSKIETDLASYFEKSNIDVLFRRWVRLADPISTSSVLNGGLLRKEVDSHNSQSSNLVLNVNPDLSSLVNSAEKLSSLGFEVPSLISKKVDEFKFVQPIVQTLKEHLEIFESIVKVDCIDTAHGKKYGFLLEMQKQKIFSQLQSLSDISWSMIVMELDIHGNMKSTEQLKSNMGSSLKTIEILQSNIHEMQLLMHHIHRAHEKINNVLLSKLMTCEYENSSMNTIIKEISTEVRSIRNAGFSDMERFVEVVNNDIAAVLIMRCNEELTGISKNLEFEKEFWTDRNNIRKCVHVISFKDNEVLVNPPLNSSKSRWVESLNHILQTEEFQCQISLDGSAQSFQIKESEHIERVILEVLTSMDQHYSRAVQYLQEWKKIHELLSSKQTAEFVSRKNENNLIHWLEYVKDSLSLKAIIEQDNGIFQFNKDTQFSFSDIQIDTLKRFDVYEKNLMNEFMDNIIKSSDRCSKELKTAQISLRADVNIQKEFSTLIKEIGEASRIRKKRHAWKDNIATLAICQSFLYRQAVKLHAGWIYVEQLEGQLSNVDTMLATYFGEINQFQDIIKVKLTNEWLQIQEKNKSIIGDWEDAETKIVSLDPPAALAVLSKFTTRIDSLERETLLLKEVADGLEIEVSNQYLLRNVSNNIEISKNTWKTIAEFWTVLEDIKEMKWIEVDILQVKRKLEELLGSLRTCPVTIRKYPAFDELQNSTKGNLKNLASLFDLRTSSVKDRHWKELFRLTSSISKEYVLITVRDVLNVEFQTYSDLIRNILDNAVGEQLIEDTLRSIKEEWSIITFETFNYADKCRLIKNWTFLLETCSNHLSTLASMKNSGSHAQFEHEREDLENRISSLQNLLLTWIEVQKQWLYLDGVFGSNNEIIFSLPIESSRFKNLSLEFLALIKRISKFNLVIELSTVNGLTESFEKLTKSLARTIKGLSEYLDKQRDSFPRFYFIGNEDLLELLGGSSNVHQINKHIKQMFPGIASLTFDSKSSSVQGFISPQGETMFLSSPVSFITNTTLAQRLTRIEAEMKLSVSEEICRAVSYLIDDCVVKSNLDQLELESFIESSLYQALVVAFQTNFTFKIENALKTKTLDETKYYFETLVSQLILLSSKASDFRLSLKIKSLLIETIHHINVIEELLFANEKEQIRIWNCQQLFYCNKMAKDPLQKIIIKQGHFEFSYGYEYLGIQERLAMTPLVSKCYLALVQAVAQNMGGAPFGPAGTGKTECVKALGQNFGRMVLVFCCDETFDFQAISRILIGVSKVGCWGCFDEFNRLEPNILSGISSQIERIEMGLTFSDLVSLSGKSFTVNPDTGIFVTMNPGYAGRNELPENLKKLFRGFSMDHPDTERIADVILTSNGFSDAKRIAKILVSFLFELESAVSKHPHYDFGLRTLKTLLNRAGSLKHRREDLNLFEETDLIAKSMIETILPRLLSADEAIFNQLLAKNALMLTHSLRADDLFLAKLNEFASSAGLETDSAIAKKALQISRMEEAHHGFMLIGNSGCGKTTLTDMVLQSLSKIDGKKFTKITIDGKVMSKKSLFGYLDPVTREWSDGLLTKILREVLRNERGEQMQRTWIVFDGDIDPEWVENLNSLLDDNKLLSLPNGERLELHPSIRIVFEVQSLDYATPATISRCGMVWFDPFMITYDMVWKSEIHLLRHYEDESSVETTSWTKKASRKNFANHFANSLLSSISIACLGNILEEAARLRHVMDFTYFRALRGLFTFLKMYLSEISNHSCSESIDINIFVCKSLFLSIIWGFAGDCTTESREKLRDYIATLDIFSGLEIPSDILTSRISYPDLNWYSWSHHVKQIELEPYQVLDSATVVPTIDTVIQESLIHGILNKHAPLILCGPPGSGKSMALFRALRDSNDIDLIPMNFSKDTSPEVVLAALEEHCEYKKTTSGVELSPKISGKWVAVFCDEINLPAIDKYGTQRVISFLRQLIEQNGFWRPKDSCWITLRNIQIVGACNDPRDPGRNNLSIRFLRHTTLVMVDYPGPRALKQIYYTFNRATLKCAPDLSFMSEALTDSMLEIYFSSKANFTPDKSSHYIYSPRELTRWCKGILETLLNVHYSDVSKLIRLWYHEGLRLFYDRLIEENDKKWCSDLFWSVANKFFPNSDLRLSLKGPVFYSTWLSGQYEPVSEVELSSFVKERLRIFGEEELNVDMILYEDLLDHALRIDRVLRQHQGHMILVGPSTSGKTSLTRFVTWMNGMKLIQLNVHSNYTISEFEDSLREVLLCCAKGEKICYLIDESSILEASFIERMNSLLANSEVPGLFEGEHLDNLNKICAHEAATQGHILDSSDELHDWFTKEISKNLHVIFTLSELKNENSPQSSPALFNRCVLSWMGDWSNSSLFVIASSLIEDVPLYQSNYSVPKSYKNLLGNEVSNFRDAVVDVLVRIHRSYPISVLPFAPKQFLSFVSLVNYLFTTRQRQLEETQRQTNVGLDKLRETVLEVTEMKKILSKKSDELKAKDLAAKEMLDKMIVSQNEAERKREFSVATKYELEKQKTEINHRKTAAMEELRIAEPAVIEAQQGVKNIKKQHLTELRSMSNPPSSVKMAMESVCVLLGYQVSSWREVQLVIRQDDFIANIVSFDNETQISSKKRSLMQETYLSRPDYNFETIHRASKACGPLLQWVIAQVRYSEMLDKVGPLREEVDALERYATKSRAQLIAIADMIQELEQSIETYKSQYSETIRSAERIKTEISTIEEKVTRSMRVIENLEKERNRWQKSIKNFQRERENLVGESILGSAFATYCGVLSQGLRDKLVTKWKNKLKEADLKFNPSLSPGLMLVEDDDLRHWQSCDLSDELFVDNFAIKSKCEFPFIIDPTGKICEVIEKATRSSSLVHTSFLSGNFIKVLEDTMKFGGTLLIKNSEFYNPILDPVIRKTITRQGGRSTIHVGTRTFIISKDFRLILYTQDARIEINPFLRSRTTIINFSITTSNLENQVLNLALGHFEPELNQKRLDLKSLQNGYNLRLLDLRTMLLQTLNSLRGSLLDSDEIIKSMESLETESVDIDRKMAESEEVIESVDLARSHYGEIAAHSKNIFRILMSLSKENGFYNFSFVSFLRVFKDVLENANSTDIEDISSALYHKVLSSFAPTLRQADKLSFCFALVTSYHSVRIGPHVKKAISKILDHQSLIFQDSMVYSILEHYIGQDDSEKLIDNWPHIERTFSGNDGFSVILSLMQQFVGFKSPKSIQNALYAYCRTVFNEDFLINQQNNWVIDDKCTVTIFSTSKNYDIAPKLKESATFSNVKILIESMGTREGVDATNSALMKAMDEGSWLLVQNVQMSISWLSHLTSKLAMRTPHDSFKLFLTCSLDSSNIPGELISMSQVVTIESQPHWKTTLLDTFNTLTAMPVEKAEMHVYFMLSWYHTTIQERLKYIPKAFKKQYDINESDATAAATIVRKIFVDLNYELNDGSTICWSEIAYRVGEIIYGGKISDVQDSRYCVNLASKLLSDHARDAKFNIVDNDAAKHANIEVFAPLFDSKADYMRWIQELPDKTPLEWAGLDHAVNDAVKEEEAKLVVQKATKLLNDIR